jgi:hypothetical protein
VRPEKYEGLGKNEGIVDDIQITKDGGEMPS